MPIVKQKSQMNDNISLTFYYGCNGNKVIPNVRCESKELLDEFLETFPNKTIISFGTHGFSKSKAQMSSSYCFINYVIERKKPSAIIVYGPFSNPIFDSIKKKVPTFVFDSWCVDYYRRGGNGQRS